MLEHFLLRDFSEESLESLYPRPARIENARLSNRDGVFHLSLTLRYGAAAQGLILRMDHPGCAEILLALFAMFEVDCLEKLKGRYVNALRDSGGGYAGAIIGIANLEPDGHQFMLVRDISKWVASLPLIKKHLESVS